MATSLPFPLSRAARTSEIMIRLKWQHILTWIITLAPACLLRKCSSYPANTSHFVAISTTYGTQYTDTVLCNSNQLLRHMLCALPSQHARECKTNARNTLMTYSTIMPIVLTNIYIARLMYCFGNMENLALPIVYCCRENLCSECTIQ